MYGAAIVTKTSKMSCFGLLWCRVARPRACAARQSVLLRTPPAPSTRAVGPNNGAPNAPASLQSRVWILSKHQRPQHSEGLSRCTTTEPSALGGSRDAAECRKVASSRRPLGELSCLLRPWLTHDQRRLWSWRSCRKSSPRRLNSPLAPGFEVNVSRAHQRDFGRLRALRRRAHSGLEPGFSPLARHQRTARSGLQQLSGQRHRHSWWRQP